MGFSTVWKGYLTYYSTYLFENVYVYCSLIKPVHEHIIVIVQCLCGPPKLS